MKKSGSWPRPSKQRTPPCAMISLVFAHSVGRAWLNANLEEQNPVSPLSVVAGRQDHEILIVCVKSPPLCLIHRWCASVSAFSHRAQLKLRTLVLFAWEPSMHPAGGQLCHRCWVWAWQMAPASWLSPWHLASALKTPVLFLFDTLVFFFFFFCRKAEHEQRVGGDVRWPEEGWIAGY